MGGWDVWMMNQNPIIITVFVLFVIGNKKDAEKEKKKETKLIESHN